MGNTASLVGGGAWDVGSFGCCAVKEQSAMQAEPRGVPVNEKQVNDVVASIRAAWSRNQKKESEAVAIYIAAMEQSSRAAVGSVACCNVICKANLRCDCYRQSKSSTQEREKSLCMRWKPPSHRSTAPSPCKGSYYGE
eukprot:1401110-Rhodomonas_salina.2